jgi:hypothetical protein
LCAQSYIGPATADAWSFEGGSAKAATARDNRWSQAALRHNGTANGSFTGVGASTGSGASGGGSFDGGSLDAVSTERAPVRGATDAQGLDAASSFFLAWQSDSGQAIQRKLLVANKFLATQAR